MKICPDWGYSKEFASSDRRDRFLYLYFLDQAQEPWESHKSQNQTPFQSWEGGKEGIGDSSSALGTLEFSGTSEVELLPLRNNYMRIFTSRKDPSSSGNDYFSFCVRDRRKEKDWRATPDFESKAAWGRHGKHPGCTYLLPIQNKLIPSPLH